MDFKKIKSLYIPQGIVKAFFRNTVLTWARVDFTIDIDNDTIKDQVAKGTTWSYWCALYNNDHAYNGGYWISKKGYVYNNKKSYYLGDSKGNKVRWNDAIVSGAYYKSRVEFSIHYHGGSTVGVRDYNYYGSVYDGTSWASWCVEQNDKTRYLWRNENGYVYQDTNKFYLENSDGIRVKWLDYILDDDYTGSYAIVDPPDAPDIPDDSLEFSSHGDGTCSVVGIGTYTDTYVDIPDSSPDGDEVTRISAGAFSGCSNITKIRIPKTVYDIGNEAFKGCSGLFNIEIPSTVIHIGKGAFHSCDNLNSITIPFVGGYKTTSGSNSHFGFIFGWDNVDDPYNSTVPESLTEVIITDATTIHDWAFANCTGLTRIILPETLTKIGSFAFEHCDNLIGITIPSGVASIGYSAFSSCTRLKWAEVGSSQSSLTAILDGTFALCDSLEWVSLPPMEDGLIQGAPFYSCYDLRTIYYNGTLEQWRSITKSEKEYGVYSGWDDGVGRNHITEDNPKGYKLLDKNNNRIVTCKINDVVYSALDDTTWDEFTWDNRKDFIYTTRNPYKNDGYVYAQLNLTLTTYCVRLKSGDYCKYTDVIIPYAVYVYEKPKS